MKKLILTILSVVFLMTSFSGCKRMRYFEDAQIVIEGSNITLHVKLLGEGSEDAYDDMLARLKKIDEEISLTRKDSVFSYFNETAEANEAVEISLDAFNIINLALEFEALSGGAFNIAVVPIAEIWLLTVEGYAAFDPFDPLGAFGNTLPTLKRINEVMEYCDTDLLSVYMDEDTGKYYIEKSDKRVKIDLGAIAKGYATDVCYDIMKEYDLMSGAVNFSGNAKTFNNFYDGKDYVPWYTKISSPRPRYQFFRNVVCSLNLEGNLSSVTSGDYERYYVHESGIAPCHIIDGRTGIPAGIKFVGETDEDNLYAMMDEAIVSATIICESSAMADALSTASFVMGMEDAVSFLDGIDGVRAVLFSENYTTFTPYRMAIVGDLTLNDDYQEYKEYTLFERG